MSTETQALIDEVPQLEHPQRRKTLKLTPEELWRYRQNGYLIFERLFSPAELRILKGELTGILAEDSARRVLEKSGSVRTVFASHLTNEVFSRLARLARLVEPARQLLSNDVYIHQFKINAKVALEGDQWEWHQDYLYWMKEDSMPRPAVVTAALFIEETNEFNGPMLVIPGSHLGGVVDIDLHEKYRETGKKEGNAHVQPKWAATLTADLKYKIDKDILRGLMEKRSIYSVTVPAGSVMFFHGNLFHASTNNLSPWDRISVFITYNSVKNALGHKENPRPEFIAARDFSPVESIEDNALLDWRSEGHA